MNAELLSNFSELLKTEWNKEVLTALKTLVDTLNQQVQEEEDQQLKAFLEDPENEVANFSSSPSEQTLEFKQLYDQYKEKRKVYAEQRAKEERENLAKKLDLIKQIEAVTKSEENISKAFTQFNELNEAFNAVGRIPGDKHKDIQTSYHAAVDQFYYNIRIYQDLKELDLKKNLDVKTALVTEIEGLAAKAPTKEVEDAVKKNQEEWYATGPVPKEDYEALKEKFQKACDAVYENLRSYHQERKEKMKENLELKQALLSKVSDINISEINSHKAWKKETEALLKIQEEWKAIGFGPKKENELVWAEFRKVCDAFFEAKNQFYAVLKKEQDVNQVKKIQLCEAAEALKDSTEWGDTAKKLVRLQNDWKKLGPARQKDEQKLWNRFRGACNHFFDSRTKHFEEKEASFGENLTLKKALIEKIDATKLADDKTENVKTIKALTQEWSQIGQVPKSDFKAINEQYDVAIGKLFDQSGISKSEIEQGKFVAKITAILNSNDADFLIDKEIKFLKDKISEQQATVIQYENNLGFFSGNTNNPLVKDVTAKIEKGKGIIEKIDAQIRLIKKMKREHAKQIEAAAEVIETVATEE